MLIADRGFVLALDNEMQVPGLWELAWCLVPGVITRYNKGGDPAGREITMTPRHGIIHGLGISLLSHRR